MKYTILFDLDGTLIDSTNAILNSFKDALKILNLDIKEDIKIKNLIGYPLKNMFAMLYPDYFNLIDEFVKIYRECYSKIYLEQTTLLPKVDQALHLAYNFADLGIVTTKGGTLTPILLESLNIKKFFKTLITLDDVKNPKPDAEPILLALNRLNKTQENAYMIGDTILDIQASLAANITPIALSCGYGDEDELKKYSQIFPNAYEAIIYILNIKQI
ncbi:HAD family hydrolase [Campylobacter sp. RM9929]|uniref:HAD family hydrolase n=1 Tax=Campylobacter molothri TaxID=1032242 RepID=UPI001E0AB739|nr:HAD family hydrolase [Campylobacter sp. RM10537]MBZ7936733.1 HAD family hydrolase [Campylobacter sp. RM10538]MBZ7947057.1 HAD family hydrolase [Campylobacter sp. RM10536]MBZ7947572.1 HAD family hydrolase [Campylobacter sp. RM9929]MBZ7951965.1 HAD family hydrolase [Campylobacter sp. RM9939]MBZ7957342.1 HAD family hydrolase [Campylobacter sp. RM10541]MBZ7966154.1 HAD family hydrolase [Campylobacter sp. RM10535]MBZ7968190.1 HAD family hydrolase [Campylobacter sp. RM9759]